MNFYMQFKYYDCKKDFYIIIFEFQIMWLVNWNCPIRVPQQKVTSLVVWNIQFCLNEFPMNYQSSQIKGEISFKLKAIQIVMQIHSSCVLVFLKYKRWLYWNISSKLLHLYLNKVVYKLCFLIVTILTPYNMKPETFRLKKKNLYL